MTMKRKKTDWLKLIDDCHLTQNFEDYCVENDLKQHLKGKKVLSRKRLACAFMRSIYAVIKTPWLD